MAVRIRITGAGRLSIRIDAASVVTIETGNSSARPPPDEDRGRLSVYTRAPRGRGRRGVGPRRDDGGSVTPAMEAAAIEAFLAAANAARLGRTLAEVYQAMDAVRRRLDEPDDD